MRKKLCVKRHAVTQPLEQPYRFIPLTRNMNAVVDVGDFDFLSRWNWIAHKSSSRFYAVRRPDIKMHRVVMRCPPDKEVDHENHNGLDNRKENLRICSHLRNGYNRLPYKGRPFKGVYFRKDSGKWRAYITCETKRIHLGNFPTALEAARAYNEAAVKYHGEFARLNLLYGCTPIA